MIRRLVFLTMLSSTMAPWVAWADNTTPATAYSLAVGGTPVEATVNSVGPVERWYSTHVSQGRSYCAETQGGVAFDNSPTALQVDTVVTIYQADASTIIVSNDGISGLEPAARSLSRACFQSTLPDQSVIFIQVISHLAGSAFNVRMRFVETTRYSNWFFIGGDYNAFTLLRNRINAPLAYTVQWRNAGGAIVGTTSGTIPSQGGTTLDARTFVTTAVSGTVQIAHDGAESALVASTTVLSGTTGLSFDAPFQSRDPW